MKYKVILLVDDEFDGFTKDQIYDMIEENMLDHVDNAPFDIQLHDIEEI